MLVQEINKVLYEDGAIRDGIKRWLSRDDVESRFMQQWLDDWQLDSEDNSPCAENFADALWEKMDAKNWVEISINRWHRICYILILESIYP